MRFAESKFCGSSEASKQEPKNTSCLAGIWQRVWVACHSGCYFPLVSHRNFEPYPCGATHLASACSLRSTAEVRLQNRTRFFAQNDRLIVCFVICVRFFGTSPRHSKILSRQQKRPPHFIQRGRSKSISLYFITHLYSPIQPRHNYRRVHNHRPYKVLHNTNKNSNRQVLLVPDNKPLHKKMHSYPY